MDDRSVLTIIAASLRGTASVDQAVFTSIRSPMGEGYRIIAASGGMRADEKAEITRRAPSHGSLCDTREDAVAMTAYPLASGRFCISHSQYAGAEHTGRGGQRVYTHVAVLDAAMYEMFGCNPFTVFAGLHKLFCGNPQLKSDAGLEQLSLPAPRALEGEPIIAKPSMGHAGTGGSVPSSNVQIATLLCRAAFEKESWLVFGAENELSAAYQALITIPSTVRRNLSISVGLKFTPSRQIQFSFVQGDLGEAQRAIRGRNVQWLEPKTIPARKPSTYDSWLDLVGRWLTEGRTGDLERLSRGINQDGSTTALTRYAALCKDIDSVPSADEAQVERLGKKLVQLEPKTGVDELLVFQLDECMTSRTGFRLRETASSNR